MLDFPCCSSCQPSNMPKYGKGCLGCQAGLNVAVDDEDASLTARVDDEASLALSTCDLCIVCTNTIYVHPESSICCRNTPRGHPHKMISSEQHIQQCSCDCLADPVPEHAHSLASMLTPIRPSLPWHFHMKLQVDHGRSAEVWATRATLAMHSKSSSLLHPSRLQILSLLCFAWAACMWCCGAKLTAHIIINGLMFLKIMMFDWHPPLARTFP